MTTGDGRRPVDARPARPVLRTRASLSPLWRNGLLALTAASSLWTILGTFPEEPAIGAAIVALLLLISVPIAYMRVDVVVEVTGMTATLFPVTRRQFTSAEIAEVVPVEGRGGVADGMGLRYLGPQQWALVVGGPAVRITRHDGSGVVVSTPEPDAVAGAWRRVAAR